MKNYKYQCASLYGRLLYHHTSSHQLTLYLVIFASLLQSRQETAEYVFNMQFSKNTRLQLVSNDGPNMEPLRMRPG